MDRTLDTLTALLLDPFLTCGEAEREAVAYRFAIPAHPASPRRNATASRTPKEASESDSSSFASC